MLLYQWWVFVHLVGVFGMLSAHGASIVLAFRLRRERDPQRVETVLQLSGASIRAFYGFLSVLLVGGIAATTEGRLWGYGWIWASIATLVALTLTMYAVARPYYRRVRVVSGAMAAGSTAVTPEQFDQLLRSRISSAIIGTGSTGLILILYLMLFKPTLGVAPTLSSADKPAGAQLTLVATELSFSAETIEVPAGQPFALGLDNRSSSPHNISVHRNSETLLVGDVFSGPATMTYQVPALARGTYGFQCDVHPGQMAGKIEAR